MCGRDRFRNKTDAIAETGAVVYSGARRETRVRNVLRRPRFMSVPIVYFLLENIKIKKKKKNANVTVCAQPSYKRINDGGE